MNAPVQTTVADGETLHRVATACKRLGCGRSQLYAWMSAGALEYVEVEGMQGRRIKESAIVAFIARRVRRGGRS